MYERAIEIALADRASYLRIVKVLNPNRIDATVEQAFHAQDVRVQQEMVDA